VDCMTPTLCLAERTVAVSGRRGHREVRMNERPNDGLRVKYSFGNLVRCAECACLSGLRWPGWRAYRMDDPAHGERPGLAFFCPECAEREFGYGAV
jgi:hypothetical protein